MPSRSAGLLALTLLASCGGAASNAEAAATEVQASDWVIGPVIKGDNYSRGVPLHPTPLRGGGWYIDLPQAPGSVRYVTFRHGSLAGKSRVVLRYRVEAAPGVRILARTDPKPASMITPYFQRRGDDWTARGRFETYRWYATFATHTPIRPGNHLIVAPLDGPWTAVETSNARNNPAAFRAAKAEADQVGFVLGGGDGYGHGVFATGRARLIVTEFRVE
jgi:hypothetical protein